MWLAKEAKTLKGDLQAEENEKSNIFMNFVACASSDNKKICSASWNCEHQSAGWVSKRRMHDTMIHSSQCFRAGDVAYREVGHALQKRRPEVRA